MLQVLLVLRFRLPVPRTRSSSKRPIASLDDTAHPLDNKSSFCGVNIIQVMTSRVVCCIPVFPAVALSGGVFDGIRDWLLKILVREK